MKKYLSALAIATCLFSSAVMAVEAGGHSFDVTSTIGYISFMK